MVILAAIDWEIALRAKEYPREAQRGHETCPWGFLAVSLQRKLDLNLHNSARPRLLPRCIVTGYVYLEAIVFCPEIPHGLMD